MGSQTGMPSSVRAGDVQGRGRIYGIQGDLITQPGESILKVAEGWDMHASTPWRRVLPKVIFLGFNPRASSRLYITTTRVVLIREIDPSRELAGEMTLLGMPTAIAKEVRLRQLKAAGVRQFCEVLPSRLRIVRSEEFRKHGSLLNLFLEDLTGTRYALSFWKTDGRDEETLRLIESRFPYRQNERSRTP